MINMKIFYKQYYIQLYLFKINFRQGSGLKLFIIHLVTVFISCDLFIIPKRKEDELYY